MVVEAKGVRRSPLCGWSSRNLEWFYIPTFAFAWRATNLVKVESDRTNAGPIHLQTLTSANTSTYIRLLPPTFVPVAVTLGCC